MSPTLWVCLLSLQGCLLTHCLQCSDGGRDCARTAISLVQTRVRRHTDSDRERGAHHTNLPGTFTAKGFPNTLIQADRSRRHLNMNKKKPVTRKSRVGTYSLLNHNLLTPLQVVRARRHTGAATPHLPPLKTVKQRSRRSAAKNKKSMKAVVCS